MIRFRHMEAFRIDFTVTRIEVSEGTEHVSAVALAGVLALPPQKRYPEGAAPPLEIRFEERKYLRYDYPTKPRDGKAGSFAPVFVPVDDEWVVDIVNGAQKALIDELVERRTAEKAAEWEGQRRKEAEADGEEALESVGAAAFGAGVAAGERRERSRIAALPMFARAKGDFRDKKTA